VHKPLQITTDQSKHINHFISSHHINELSDKLLKNVRILEQPEQKTPAHKGVKSRLATANAKRGKPLLTPAISC
jgi:hypothetical protein